MGDARSAEAHAAAPGLAAMRAAESGLAFGSVAPRFSSGSVAVTLSVARGSEANSQPSNIGAREAFADWLGTWWGIARVRLADQPGVLGALGVVPK